MKLILAIVHDEDASKVITALSSKGYSVTRLCSSGGFLKAGNTTLLIGLTEVDLRNALNIIKENSKSRTHYLQSSPHGMYIGDIPLMGTEIAVGGATVFVMDVERMEKF